MAKVTITFEDLENGGTNVKIISDLPFAGPAATSEEHDAMTDAQQMGIRITELLTEELMQHEAVFNAGTEHIHDENCHHDDHDH